VIEEEPIDAAFAQVNAGAASLSAQGKRAAPKVGIYRTARTKRARAWWTKAVVPFQFLDTWLSTLEGDIDAPIIARARECLLGDVQTHRDDEDDQHPRGAQKPRSRAPKSSNIEILPSSAFYATPFMAPTKSPAEARKIALLQLDRLTAIPPQEALIAIGGPVFVGEDGQSQFQLFVAKKKGLADLRRSSAQGEMIEAFVAFDASNGADDEPIGAVFRDDAGQSHRAARRIAMGALIVLCAGLASLAVWSMQQRFDRQSAQIAMMTRQANQAKTTIMAQRAETLSQLSAFAQGATGSSADRVLVTLSDMTARMPKDTRLQLIDIRQDKVRLKGTAKDATAARAAFTTPVQAGQSQTTGSPSPQSVVQSNPTMPGPPNGAMIGPSGPPIPLTPPNPILGTPSSPAASSPVLQWQDFDIEVPASTVRVASSTPSNQSQDFAPNLPTTSNGATSRGQP
jgi:hypothetical protein